MTSISDGTTTLAPQLIDGWEARRTIATVVHDVIGARADSYSLAPAGLRSGTLRIVVGTSDALAAQLDTMLSAGATYTLADTSRPSVGMTFIVDCDYRLYLDDETRRVWIIEAGFREVSA